jgi:hypothetical protein
VALKIDDTIISSNQSAHTARHVSGRGGWKVSWLPGQILDRNTAITAMILADTASEQDVHEGHRLWPHIQGWAEELGLTAPDAIAKATRPPSHINCRHGQASRQAGREAAD